MLQPGGLRLDESGIAKLIQGHNNLPMADMTTHFGWTRSKYRSWSQWIALASIFQKKKAKEGGTKNGRN
jgi:hypothetical protein